jgi:type IV secretory pathway VirB4 component
MKRLTLTRLLQPGTTSGATWPATVVPGAPDAVEVSGRHLRAGDDYTTTLAVVGYPAEVGAGWLEPLLAYPGRLDVSLHIEPIPPAVAADRLRKQRGRLEASRRSEVGRGGLDDPALDAAAADAAELATRLARGEGRLFRVGLYLTVHGNSPADVAERAAEVRSVAASLLLDLVPATWRQLQGWTTSLPLALDALAMTRTFDTAALAAAFPFTSPDLPTPDTGPGMGVLYGLNLASPGVVVWDRWDRDNYNAVILGTSGGGKSYLAKLDLLRNLYLGVEAFVIDPEDEYLALAEAVGGIIIRPGTPGVRINPLDLPDQHTDQTDAADDAVDEGGNGDVLVRRALFMHTFVEVLLTGADPTAAGLNSLEAAALDVAVLAAYRGKGITMDPRTWRRPAPLLADVTTALTDTGGDAGRGLAARLAPFVSGSFSGMFAGPTTTRPDGHLVVYAIRDLPEELKPVGTLLILDTIWRTLNANAGQVRVRRLVLVDEAWLLLLGYGARFLLRLAKSARKLGAGLTVVTQDVADVLSTDAGRAVVSNAVTQILLRQAPQAIDTVGDAFGLTDGERAFLLSATRGDALLAAGSSRVAFRALASDTEHHLVANTPQFADPSARGK